MIRVAQVMAGAGQGGAESFFVRLAKGLEFAGEIDQHAFIRKQDARLAELRAAGVAADGFRFGGPLQLTGRRRFNRALENFDADIVLAWMNRANQRVPRGRHQHISRLGNYYNLKYHRHADFWIGNARGICDYLVRSGMPAERVFQIPNFADEATVAPVPRTSFATPAGVPVILAAGRLHPDKAFDTLLRALAGITDAVLWLAGSGPEEQPLRDLAQKLGVAQRVRFLGWRSDITALMRSADLFVCSSRHEGFGSIVLESWAHGCPIVATAAQGPKELIEDGVTGLLTPIDDSAALAGAIGQLLQQPQARKALAETALAHYYRHFSERRIVQQYNELFQTVHDFAR